MARQPYSQIFPRGKGFYDKNIKVQTGKLGNGLLAEGAALDLEACLLFLPLSHCVFALLTLPLSSSLCPAFLFVPMNSVITGQLCVSPFSRIHYNLFFSVTAFPCSFCSLWPVSPWSRDTTGAMLSVACKLTHLTGLGTRSFRAIEHRIEQSSLPSKSIGQMSSPCCLDTGNMLLSVLTWRCWSEN